jgi:hypothetical protein
MDGYFVIEGWSRMDEGLRCLVIARMERDGTWKDARGRQFSTMNQGDRPGRQ